MGNVLPSPQSQNPPLVDTSAKSRCGGRWWRPENAHVRHSAPDGVVWHLQRKNCPPRPQRVRQALMVKEGREGLVAKIKLRMFIRVTDDYTTLHAVQNRSCTYAIHIRAIFYY